MNKLNILMASAALSVAVIAQAQTDDFDDLVVRFEADPVAFIVEMTPLVNAVKALARNCRISLELKPNVKHDSCNRMFDLHAKHDFNPIFLFGKVAAIDARSELNLPYSQEATLQDALGASIDIQTISLLIVD